MTEPAAWLAIDPGDTSGWCTFDAAGELLAMGQERTKTDSEFNKFITDKIDSSLSGVICEDYVLFKHKAMAQTNSRGRNLNTAKQVGKVQLLCELKNVEFIKQPAANYRIGAMWGGFEIPSNHAISHQYCAA